MSQSNKFIIGLFVLVIVGVVLYFSFFTGKEPPDHDLEKDVVAIVGPRKITTDQFMEESKRRSTRPEKLDKQTLLDEMIDYEAILVKAMEAGLDKDPELIRMYRNMLVGRYKQQYLTPQIESASISDEDIRNHYDNHLPQYTQPSRIRLAILYMAVHHTMSEETKLAVREKMQEAREKAMNLTDVSDFGALAIEYSEDQSTRYRGGDIGWISKGLSYRWDQSIIDAGFALQHPGDISEIIETQDGLYLIKLMDRQESLVKPFDQVKEQIRHKMLLEKRKDIENAFKKQIRITTDIKIFPEVLNKIQIVSSGSEITEPQPPKMP